MNGPKIVYVGNQGGLKPVEQILREGRITGDAGSPTDYAVLCACGATLGMLATFRPNAEGYRSPWCPVCEHATYIDKDGQIVGHVPVDRATVGAQLTILAKKVHG